MSIKSCSGCSVAVGGGASPCVPCLGFEKVRSERVDLCPRCGEPLDYHESSSGTLTPICDNCMV